MSSTDKPDFSKVQGTVRGTSGEVPDFSKVQGSVRSEALPEESRTYTVEKGDTLSHIAKAQYGRASQWKAIFDANRDVLDDPDKIRPGQVLKIPTIETSMDRDEHDKT
ncbi:MAG TPA: LysM peptidoglycan-binding domain-containing protein [Lysobacter sp.]|jgi:nucleoid-associated protein YgaU|nr:LysM peptidoglycan-binding domain-containing protein [Lysobacter sp.]